MPYVALIFPVGTAGGGGGEGKVKGKVVAASFGCCGGGGAVVSTANVVRGDGGGGGGGTPAAADDDDGSGAGKPSVVALSTGAGIDGGGELTVGTIAASAPGAVGMGAAREVGTWS